jgi:hypothetical protein
MNNVLIDVSGIDMSARTSALTLSLTSGQRIHGNWTFGSGITLTGAQPISYYGRNTQVITSAGKTFSGGIAVNSYGGTVELADALNVGNKLAYRHQWHLRHQRLQRDGWVFVVQQQQRA